jgi:hypothetical protein
MKSCAHIQTVPKASCMLDHNREVNQGSQSETIDTGTPCNLTTSFIYNRANLSIESVIFIGKKRADLVNLSIITHIASLPFFPLGKPNTKSIVMSSQGINNDCKGLPASDVLPLLVGR